MDAFQELMKKRLKNYLECDGCISGYVEEEKYEILLNELRESGYKYAVRTSNKSDASDSFSFSYTPGKTGNTPEISYFGSPFQAIKTTMLECSLGPHYYKKDEQTDEGDHPYVKKKRFNITNTKRIGCPACLVVKCIKVFPDYMAKNPSWRSKKIVVDKLLEDLRSNSPPQGQLRYYLKGSVSHSHSTTVVNLNQPIHPIIKNEIRKLVEAGITSTAYIQTHLKTFTTNLFEEEKAPSSLNRAYFPSRKVIYNHIHQTIFELKKTTVDQEALERAVAMWKNQAPNSSIFYRPFTDDETLLFCYQTSWQKHLLERYGKICLLDATYKTTKYSLPLFFLCVKTNVNYSVVYTFVVQAEKKVLIAEALRLLSQWCENWSPTYFMTDFSEIEIAAVEAVFPHATVYLCAFHREQAWLRWLRKAGNVEYGTADELLTLWRSVADAKTESEFSANVKMVQEAADLNPKAHSYFSSQWLPHCHRWVQCFSFKDFVTVINTTNGVESQNKILKHTYLCRNSDKTLTGILKIIIQQYLPDTLKKYAEKNSVYKVYNDELPKYLCNRPALFIKHMMSRLASARAEITKGDIFVFDEGLLGVKSTNSTQNYIVDFDSPKCSCPDFGKYRLPCKHMCAAIEYLPGYFEKLPDNYINSPYFTLDNKYSLCIETEHEADEPSNFMATERAAEKKETTANNLPNLLQILREEAKQWIDMTYLCVDTNLEPAIVSAIEVLQSKRLEVAKLLPSSSGLSILPPVTTKVKKTEYKQLPQRKKKVKKVSKY